MQFEIVNCYEEKSHDRIPLGHRLCHSSVRSSADEADTNVGRPGPIQMKRKDLRVMEGRECTAPEDGEFCITGNLLG